MRIVAIGPITPRTRKSGSRPMSAPQSGMTRWLRKSSRPGPELVQVVDDGHGGILAPRASCAGRRPGGGRRRGIVGRRGRSSAGDARPSGQAGWPRFGLPRFAVAPRPGRQPVRAASASRAAGRPGSPPIDLRRPRSPIPEPAGGRGRPTLGAARRGRASRRTTHDVPIVAAPRVRRSWARRPSSVTTRSAGVGPVAIAARRLGHEAEEHARRP